MKVKTKIYFAELQRERVLIIQLDNEYTLIANQATEEFVDIYVVDKNTFKDLMSYLEDLDVG